SRPAAGAHLLVHPPGGRPALRPVQQVRGAAARLHRRRPARPDRLRPGAAMYRVTREIYFCYGHRLLNYDGKCRHLHGHNGRAVITLQADRLDPLGMVMDFTRIKEVVTAWIDDTLDHKMLLHKEDPALPFLRQLGEPVFVMEVNPTAENIARLI